MLNKAELLLPAGSLTKLKTAILYGADAVYAGTPDMCLRAQSKMTLEDLEEGIKFVISGGLVEPNELKKRKSVEK